ncbi:odorant-binding protein 99d [Cochliomyia hominivorax]
MLLQTVVLFLLMLTGINSEMWKMPTATEVQETLEVCQSSQKIFLNVEDNENASNEIDIRCITKRLGLWSDEEGFKAKRFIKLLTKYHQPIEIVVVINYCNDTHKQDNLKKWANEAYNCFARGRIGSWINDYIKNFYKNKLTK